MEKIEQLLKANKPVWAKFAVIETSGLNGTSIVYFQKEPYINPFSGKFTVDGGKTEVIELSVAKNILFEL